ncbi:hypothetical protein BDF14DRAFT_1747957 [Spinellus fusiger]|nr:hypothetical protein BDF14DRAFT_1747957 [Spinellus fusiger]
MYWKHLAYTPQPPLPTSLTLPATAAETTTSPLSVPIPMPTIAAVQTRKQEKAHLVTDKDVPSVLVDRKHGKRYMKGTCLGEGGFARVYQVKGEQNEMYAAKVVAKAALRPNKNKEKLLAEINIHRSMNHHSILRFFNCFEDTYNVYMIVEFCHNKTLAELMKTRGRLTEPEVRFILIQTLDACLYMHENRVIHRDIKLGNILLDKNMDVKVGDFGLSALLLSKEERKRTICGTPNYIAPEILFGKEGHDCKVDIWSIGVLTYTLLVGRHPFHQNDLREIYKKIRHNSLEASYEFPPEIHISKVVRDLIAHLLVNDPKKRLSIPQVLMHLFFHGNLPERLPLISLVRKPTREEMFPDPPQKSLQASGKAADALRSAIGGATEYIERKSLAPLELLSENVPDYRSQFPALKKAIYNQQPISTPIPTNQKRSSLVTTEGSRQRRKMGPLQLNPSPTALDMPRKSPLEPLHQNINIKTPALLSQQQESRRLDRLAPVVPLPLKMDNQATKENYREPIREQRHKLMQKMPKTVPVYQEKESRVTALARYYDLAASEPDPIYLIKKSLEASKSHVPISAKPTENNTACGVYPGLQRSTPQPLTFRKPEPLLSPSATVINSTNTANTTAKYRSHQSSIKILPGHENNFTYFKKAAVPTPVIRTASKYSIPTEICTFHETSPYLHEKTRPQSICSSESLVNKPLTPKHRQELPSLPPFSPSSVSTVRSTTIPHPHTPTTPRPHTPTTPHVQTSLTSEAPKDVSENSTVNTMSSYPITHHMSHLSMTHTNEHSLPKPNIEETAVSNHSSRATATEKSNLSLSTPIYKPAYISTLQFLKRLSRTLHCYIANVPLTLSPTNKPHTEEKPTPFKWSNDNTFVDNWIDYTSRYGFCYGLTDGKKGFLFNDQTSLTTQDEITFIYHNDFSDPVYQSYHKNDVPDFLTKKHKLISTLIHYMNDNLGKTGPEAPLFKTSKSVYVSKFMAGNDAVVFKLTNNVIQFNFYDGNKLAIAEYGEHLIHLDPSRNPRRYTMKHIFASRDDFLIDYVKSALQIIDENIQYQS